MRQAWRLITRVICSSSMRSIARFINFLLKAGLYSVWNVSNGVTSRTENSPARTILGGQGGQGDSSAVEANTVNSDSKKWVYFPAAWPSVKRRSTWLTHLIIGYRRFTCRDSKSGWRWVNNITASLSAARAKVSLTL